MRKTTEAVPRTAAAQSHVFDAGSTQGFELAHDLVWRADQAVRLCFFGRMTIGQDMRSDGAVWPTRHRQNAFMELAIAFEGVVLGGLVVDDLHVARKGNPQWIVGTPARRALGLEYGNALADDVERCELVGGQIVAALGHSANGRGGSGGHPERRVRFLAGRRLDQDVVEGPETAVVGEALP